MSVCFSYRKDTLSQYTCLSRTTNFRYFMLSRRYTLLHSDHMCIFFAPPVDGAITKPSSDLHCPSLPSWCIPKLSNTMISTISIYHALTDWYKLTCVQVHGQRKIQVGYPCLHLLKQHNVLQSCKQSQSMLFQVPSSPHYNHNTCLSYNSKSDF